MNDQIRGVSLTDLLGEETDGWASAVHLESCCERASTGPGPRSLATNKAAVVPSPASSVRATARKMTLKAPVRRQRATATYRRVSTRDAEKILATRGPTGSS